GDLLLPGHPQQMRGEERDLRHVVAAERIVRIRDIVLAETDIDVSGQEFPHPRMQRAGVGVADDADARLPHQKRLALVAHRSTSRPSNYRSTFDLTMVSPSGSY